MEAKMIEREKNITDNLRNAGVFDIFYRPFLMTLEGHLNTIEQETGLFLDTDVRKNVLYYAKECMMEYSARVLIHEMNKRKQEYDVFCGFIDNNPQEIYSEYPVLYSRLTQKVESICRNISEISQALLDCQKEIWETYGIDIYTLRNIRFGQGDTHNNGKTVAILNFDQEDRIVYKPRNMYPEKAFARCCELLNSWFSDGELKNPRLIVREEYGFQEYIESRECLSTEEVKNYYHRVGRAMGIFYILNTTDIHAENIIPQGEYPVFIDLESLSLAPRKKEHIKEGSMNDIVVREIEHSILSSNLLPRISKGSALDVDISGLGGAAGQQSQKLKCSQLLERGTTDIRFEEVFYTTEIKGNVVRLNGESVNYSDYLPDIKAGFDEAYDAMMQNRECLLNKLPEYLEQGRYRQILRGTFLYARFMQASMHPRYCRTFDSTRKLLKLISARSTNQSDSEIEQMLNNDIPYFYSVYNERTLYTGDRKIEEEYFEKSIGDRIKQNVMNLSPEDKKNQLNIIHNSIKFAQNELNSYSGILPDSIMGKDFGADVLQNIIAEIRNRALWNEDKKACTFMDVSISNNTYTGSLDYTLYDGIGLIWFLFTYAIYTQNPDDMGFAKAALAGMEELASSEKAVLSSSVFGGYYGYIYLYYNLYRLTSDRTYYEQYRNAIDRIVEYDVSSETIFDVIGGVSGAIIVLANIYKAEKDSRLKKIIDKYCAFLEKSIRDKEDLLTGFSHGYAGFQFAFMKAYEATGKKKYVRLAEMMENTEDVYYQAEQNNWLDLREDKKHCCLFWCHGAPGILLGRSYYADREIFNGKYRKTFDRILDQLRIGEKDVFNDSLCHGRIGNLEALRAIALNTNNEELYRKVEECFCEEVKSIKETGVIYGLPQLKGCLSFMLGLSGIGYGLLRHKMKSLPLVLVLETM